MYLSVFNLGVALHVQMVERIVKHKFLNTETGFVPFLLAYVQITQFHPGFLISHESTYVFKIII